MTQSFELAQAYITTLTGHPDTVMDWRIINDTNKAVAAHTLRGMIREVFPTLQQYNQNGWGIFCCINAMDGQGRELANVQAIRTHVVDLDNVLTSQANYEKAISAYPQPHFAVQTSPQKYHLYWLVEPYTGNDFYTFQQRKFAQIYDGDKKIIDPTRVLRVPGFYHLKAEPFLTNCWMIHSGARWTSSQIADSLQHINVINHVGVRAPLGDIEMQAPSLEWLRYALFLLNPNDLDRQEWLSISAAFKQAGWTLADEQTLLGIWQEWCAHYTSNDIGENLKMWNSVRETEVGWDTFKRRTSINAWMMHNGLQNVPTQRSEPIQKPPVQETIDENAGLPEILDAGDCAKWFKNCYFVGRAGEIFNTSGRFMNSTQFNALYGGKHFIISLGGKVTDEAWRAALRSTVYTIPKVDHIRFLPDHPQFAIVEDELGRKGLNTYLPVKIRSAQGDIQRFHDWFKLVLPNDNDRKIWIEYMAHCIKYPGYKIPWAPMLQSVQGAGKSVIYEIMKFALGAMYVYTPKAQELATSGSKFNAWMRSKLCIIVNEIKVDERRELIEILKPMITDAQIEVQAKGVDQEMEDNPANWIFFSNFKDAIPLNQNDRRYALFFSPIQTKKDKIQIGLSKAYFDELFGWLKNNGGFEAMTYYLQNYPIAKGTIYHEAPESSSYQEALRISRSPMQIVAEESIQDNVQGFRGGYVSSLALIRRVIAAGIRTPSNQSVRALLESMGYAELGRALECYPFEDITNRPIIYANSTELTLEGYKVAQGYEPLGV